MMIYRILFFPNRLAKFLLKFIGKITQIYPKIILEIAKGILKFVECTAFDIMGGGGGAPS